VASEFPRGSEWRKWDLHVHTPFTHLSNGYQGDWDAFAQAIRDADLALIAATNYFCFSQDEIERVRHELAARGCTAAVLPNAEFRIEHPNQHGEWINIHVIFSEQINTADINASLSRLPLLNTTEDQRPVYCEISSLQGSGLDFTNILVSLRTLLETLRRDFKLGKDFVVAALPRGHGAFRPAQGDGRGNALAVEIDKSCQLMFGTDGDREFYLNVARYEGALAKPVYSHSDAHSTDAIGERFTWVKADPTFQGLKQTVYEPEDRVKLQANSPQLDFRKPFFEKLLASGEIMGADGPRFGAVEIPLNRNLVTLIGGRGTGKSILLDCIFKTFGRTSAADDGRLKRLSPENVQVHYEKSDGDQIVYDAGKQDQLSYLHVRQGDIRQYVTQPDELSRQIKQLLGIESTDSVPEYDFEATDLLERILKSKSWFKQEDADGNRINTEEHNKARLDGNKQLIETITTEQNKELIEQYKNNRQSVNAKEAVRKSLRELAVRSKADREELSSMIADVNEQDLGGRIVPTPDYKAFDNAIEEIGVEVAADIEKLRAENNAITERFREQGIDQDISGLLSKVDQYQKVIDQAEDRLQEIESRKSSISNLIQERSQLAEQIANDIEGQKEDVDSRFAELKRGREDWTSDQQGLVEHLLSEIDVKGEVKFDVDAFYGWLKELLNGQKFRSTNTESQLDRIRDRMGVSSYEDYLKLLRGESIITDSGGEKITLVQFASDDSYFLKTSYDIFDYLFSYRYRTKYLGVKAVITYKGKTPEKLSVGQRGTFYVCMKLATDPFGSPFVFDQPEDDLDNEFIMDELVPLFRKIKKYRQVIVATHNANLVVNADAEQVIVASNNDEVLTYESGSLEHSESATGKGIREEVCRVLEGGRTAFEKREWKYGFRHI